MVVWPKTEHNENWLNYHSFRLDDCDALCSDNTRELLYFVIKLVAFIFNKHDNETYLWALL